MTKRCDGHDHGDDDGCSKGQAVVLYGQIVGSYYYVFLMGGLCFCWVGFMWFLPLLSFFCCLFSSINHPCLVCTAGRGWMALGHIITLHYPYTRYICVHFF